MPKTKASNARDRFHAIKNGARGMRDAGSLVSNAGWNRDAREIRATAKDTVSVL